MEHLDYEKTTLNYKVGDATEPVGKGNKIICHICNDIGGWGRGFVLALSNKWKAPEDRYRSLGASNLTLGMFDLVQVEDDIWVANMVAQHDTRPNKVGVPPIRYGALENALKGVAAVAKSYNATVHMPRIGTGLAGGDWDLIEKIIIKTLSNNCIKVTIYDLPKYK